MNISTEAMDKFNRAMGRLISQAELGRRDDMALQFAEIKFQINKQFYESRCIEDEAAAGFPVLRIGLHRLEQ